MKLQITESKYIKTFCKNMSTLEPCVFSRYSLYVPAKQEQKFWKLIDKKYILNNRDHRSESPFDWTDAASKFLIIHPVVRIASDIHCMNVRFFLNKN